MNDISSTHDSIIINNILIYKEHIINIYEKNYILYIELKNSFLRIIYDTKEECLSDLQILNKII